MGSFFLFTDRIRNASALNLRGTNLSQIISFLMKNRDSWVFSFLKNTFQVLTFKLTCPDNLQNPVNLGPQKIDTWACTNWSMDSYAFLPCSLHLPMQSQQLPNKSFKILPSGKKNQLCWVGRLEQHTSWVQERGMHESWILPACSSLIFFFFPLLSSSTSFRKHVET